jgi:hypothetical protein
MPLVDPSHSPGLRCGQAKPCTCQPRRRFWGGVGGKWGRAPGPSMLCFPRTCILHASAYPTNDAGRFDVNARVNQGSFLDPISIEFEGLWGRSHCDTTHTQGNGRPLHSASLIVPADMHPCYVMSTTATRSCNINNEAHHSPWVCTCISLV